MPRLREWRLLAIALGLTIGTASPASVLAHARVHHREAPEAHRHVASLEAHDGATELAPQRHPAGHQHVRLGQAMLRPAHALPFSPSVTAPVADLDCAPSTRVGDIPASSIPARSSLGGEPPRLRAPPLR